ncbi:MAG TPA: translocated intimin receptor Tir [Acidobacteriaceae bacterium]|nr:translocated intimin receptor Tir [Acidobacteriaceae bacterium]
MEAPREQPGSSRFRSILTDSQFWIPLIVLLLGVGLLVWLQ